MNDADLRLNLTPVLSPRLKRDVRDAVAEQPKVLMEKNNPTFHVCTL